MGLRAGVALICSPTRSIRPAPRVDRRTAMQDWTAGQLRYLVHFDDGGSGMRIRSEPLDGRRRAG